jgi:hypothetical protein
LTLHIVAVAALLSLAACASGASSDSSAPHVTKRVIARSLGGSPGSPPTVVPRAAPTGSGDVAQQVALADRTVRVDSASARPIARDGFVEVDVAVTLRAIGPGVIDNHPSDFSLLVSGGDVFGTTSDLTHPFWGSMADSAERAGTVTFAVPKAAQSHLQLLYRPGGAEHALVFPLTLQSAFHGGRRP